MNQSLRLQAAKCNRSLMDHLLAKIKSLKKITGMSYTIFAVCPNSMAVIRAARSKLYRNLKLNGIDAEEVLSLHIEKAMDKYFHKFNLVNLNDLIEENALTPTFHSTR